MAKPKGRERIQGDPSTTTSVRKYTMGKGQQVVYANPYNVSKARGVRNQTQINPNLPGKTYRGPKR